MTNSEYAAFLNAVDPNGLNALALYNPGMGSDNTNGGITFNSGNASGSKFTVKAGFANKPVVYVSFYDAMRFCNWLHNGGLAGVDTENGAYTLQGNTAEPLNGTTVTRNAGAKFAVPSEDEWCKAAYHQPSGLGGDTDSYWDYPTKTNFQPSSTTPPGSAPAANLNSAVGGVTPVGAYATSSSFYGTFDMAGNVYEWADTIVSGSSRVLLGGSWFSYYWMAVHGSPLPNAPEVEEIDVGFRIASP